MLKEHGIAEDHLEDLEQVVAHLTLTGGTHSAKESREIIASTPRLRDASPDLKQQIFDLLRRLYRSNGGITGLLPDLLGERLVARALNDDDELLETSLGAKASSEVARRSLTVLTRLAQRFPQERRWLAQALESYLPKRRREAREVAAGPMPEMLIETLTSSLKGTSRSGFRMVLDELWQNLPKETLYLRAFATEVSQQRLIFVENKDSGAQKVAMQLFVAHDTLAELLWSSGRFSEAADQRHEAYKQAERICKKKEDPENLCRLATASRELATTLGRVARFESALAKAERAEEIDRKLAARQPDAYRANWAKSLTTLANRLRDLGRFEDALAKAEEAEEIDRELAVGKPNVYRPDWAISLGNLANHLSDLGRFEDALAKAELAEEIDRDLAAGQPDAYCAAWATSLTNLANNLNDLGRFEDALAKAEQAEEIRRKLAARQPDAYRADWAASLINLAAHLSELGQFDNALAKAEQAEGLSRELAVGQPDAHRANWAKSLSNLAGNLSDLGRFKDALAKAEQAEELFRELAAGQPDAYRADWAKSLGVLAEMLLLNNRSASAVEPARQSAAIFLELQALRPRPNRIYLGIISRVLADILIAIEEVRPASVEAQRAHDLLVREVAERSGYGLRQLARAIYTLARCTERDLAAEVLVEGINLVAPWFEKRKQVLREPLQNLVMLLLRLAPNRLDTLPPQIRANFDPCSNNSSAGRCAQGCLGGSRSSVTGP